MSRTAKHTIPKSVMWNIAEPGDPNTPKKQPLKPAARMRQSLSLNKTAAYLSPTNKSPQLATMPQVTSTVFQPHKTIQGIDDSLVVDFSLEKFNSIRFSLRKNISLFFEHTFPLFIQSLFLPIFFIVYNLFFELNIRGKENLKNAKGPMLFISNHIGFYDSFLFDLFVKPFSRILPFRFMGSRVFIVPFLAVLKLIGIIDLVYFLFGVFRVTPGEGAEKSLKKAYEIIKRGGTVAMYPEGKIWRPTNVHPEDIGPFKWGSAILAKNTGVQVVPVSMKRIRSEDSFRSRLEIVIGKPFKVDGYKAPEQIAADMRETIVNLYNKIK